MVVGPPPLQLGEQVWRLLSSRPGATSQRGYSMSDRQIDSFNKSGIEPA